MKLKKEKLEQEKFKSILSYAFKRGNEERNLKAIHLIEEIKQQLEKNRWFRE
jgi:hypothetical protein